MHTMFGTISLQGRGSGRVGEEKGRGGRVKKEGQEGSRGEGGRVMHHADTAHSPVHCHSTECRTLAFLGVPLA